MRPAIAILLIVLLPSPSLAGEPEERLHQAGLALQEAGERLRAPTISAEQRAEVLRVCEAIYADFQWVLEHQAELPAEKRPGAVRLAYYNSACIRALQGRHANALALLEQAIDAGYENWSWLKKDPDLAGVRDHERFRWLVGSVMLDSSMTHEFVLAVQIRNALQTERPNFDGLRQMASVLLEAGVQLRASEFSKRTLSARMNYLLAGVHVRLGNRSSALRCAEKALLTGLIEPASAQVDADLQALHSDPRFLEAALAQAELWGPSEPKALELDWTWTFSEDLESATLEEQARVARGWAQTLWRVSEGNVRLRRMTLRDRSTKAGELHTPRFAVGKAMLTKETYAMTLNGVLLIPGKCGAFTFVHEVGHLLFWLPEEYDTPRGCPCAQAGERGKLVWCDSETHSKEQADLGKAPCWTTIQRRFPGLRHPGPGGAFPGLEVVLENR